MQFTTKVLDVLTNVSVQLQQPALGLEAHSVHLLFRMNNDQQSAIFEARFPSIQMMKSFFAHCPRKTKKFGRYYNAGSSFRHTAMVLPTHAQQMNIIAQVVADTCCAIGSFVQLYGADLHSHAAMYAKDFDYEDSYEVEDYSYLIDRLAAEAILKSGFEPQLPTGFKPSAPPPIILGVLGEEDFDEEEEDPSPQVC